MAKLFTINGSEHTGKTKKGTDTTTTSGDILNLLGDPEKIIEGRRTLRSQEHFTESEQFRISVELKKIAKFWDDKIEDLMDSQDHGLRCYGWCENIIKTRERSCKEGKPQLLPINDGIPDKARNEVFEGYIMSGGIM